MDKETLRKAQLVQLEIAKEIKRVCEENKIAYFLEAGTLLGAVRHKGFIPWDDDLDLGMMRQEYERFLQIAPEQLNEKYELVEWESEMNYPHPFCKVMKKGTVYREEVQKNSSKCGLWVDIFPYDHFPEMEDARKEQKVKLTTYRTMIRAKCQYKTWVAHGKTDIKKWAKNMPFRMMAVFHKKQTIVRKYEELVKKYNHKECKAVFSHGCDAYGDCVMDISCFEEFVQLPFEDTEFSCPSGYVEYLKSLYGDYMQLPPESERENRHSIIEVDFGKE